MGSIAMAQNTISGKVIYPKGKPLVSANIYIEGTYDGATSDEKGLFSFETTAKGNVTLIISSLIHETATISMDVANYKDKTISLKENVNTLDAVVITAGT